MGNTIRENVKTIKYLVVIFDKDFNWSAHMNKVKTKSAISVGILSKLRYYVNIETVIIQVYHALVGSILHYAIICWRRPHILALVPSLSYKTGLFVLFQKHLVIPGLTGFWSVSPQVWHIINQHAYIIVHSRVSLFINFLLFQ